MNSALRYFLLIVLATYAPGCAALGPLSPLRPLELGLAFSPSTEKPVPDVEAIDAWFTSDDGVRLHGRCFDHPQPRAVALFCHGNAGSVAMWADVGRELMTRHQLTVLVFDYRGYGNSEGNPTEQGVLRDGRAARTWLAHHAGIKESDILLIGRSLGGAVAVDLAASGGARGLVLESTFSSLPDVANVHAPWLMPHWNMTQRMNSNAKITKYRGPVLQCHGDADRLIPIELARKLHAAVPGKKQFIVMPGADHNAPPNDTFDRALDEFIEALPPVESK
jgi:pimeloyl-ACP methyl ester carboxylesterase